MQLQWVRHGGGLGEVDFGRSLGIRHAIPIHEVFKLGGKICHNSRSSQVKCPLEVLLIIQYPNVHLKPDATLVQLEHTHHTAMGLTLGLRMPLYS